MYIHEAVKKAIEEDGAISRGATYTQENTMCTVVKPCKETNYTQVIMCINEEAQYGGSVWEPTTEDLLANDWEVVKFKGRNVETIGQILHPFG